MAVHLLAASAEQYSLLSGDTKPTNCAVGAIATTEDTGQIYRWNGTTWLLIGYTTTATISTQSMISDRTNGLLEDLITEVRMLRQGMIQHPDSVCVEAELETADEE